MEKLDRVGYRVLIEKLGEADGMVVARLLEMAVARSVEHAFASMAAGRSEAAEGSGRAATAGDLAALEARIASLEAAMNAGFDRLWEDIARLEGPVR